MKSDKNESKMETACTKNTRTGHGVPSVVVWPLPKSNTSGLAAVLRDHS